MTALQNPALAWQQMPAMTLALIAQRPCCGTQQLAANERGLKPCGACRSTHIWPDSMAHVPNKAHSHQMHPLSLPVLGADAVLHTGPAGFKGCVHRSVRMLCPCESPFAMIAAVCRCGSRRCWARRTMSSAPRGCRPASASPSSAPTRRFGHRDCDHPAMSSMIPSKQCL